jgi:hypothetical protein
MKKEFMITICDFVPDGTKNSPGNISFYKYYMPTAQNIIYYVAKGNEIYNYIILKIF